MNAACPSPLRRVGSPLSISLRMTSEPDSPHKAAPASLGGRVPGTRIARPGRKSGRRESPSTPRPRTRNCTPGSWRTAPRSSIARTARPGSDGRAPPRSGGSIRSGRCAARHRESTAAQAAIQADLEARAAASSSQRREDRDTERARSRDRPGEGQGPSPRELKGPRFLIGSPSTIHRSPWSPHGPRGAGDPSPSRCSPAAAYGSSSR